MDHGFWVDQTSKGQKTLIVMKGLHTELHRTHIKNLQRHEKKNQPKIIKNSVYISLKKLWFSVV